MDKMLNHDAIKDLEGILSRDILKKILSDVIKDVKHKINFSEQLDRDSISEIILKKTNIKVREISNPHIKNVINATGIVLHTGLGRAPLSDNIEQSLLDILSGYCNLEIDLETGKRGNRNNHVRDLLCLLTGAENAVIVNNNAAAVLIALNTLAFGKEVIISRGQLIEIGGSFRMPDVMDKSGAIMKEVGTTNKTKLQDYRDAIGKNTGAIVVAHTSNYRVFGFTAEVKLSELVELAHAHQIPVLHDLGGGVIFDLQKYGLSYEPLVQHSLDAGVDVVTFSGDKILGGPQSGILLGNNQCIDRIHLNPIMRAVRCDKLIFAALEATLRLYLNQENLGENHKVLKYLTDSADHVREKAKILIGMLSEQKKKELRIQIKSSMAQTGSGALPLEKIPSFAVELSPGNIQIEKVAKKLRESSPPVMGYLKHNKMYLDLRTVDHSQLQSLAGILENMSL
jgi:L-seryl-tRNA(Ser) seleniumtransferase